MLYIDFISRGIQKKERELCPIWFVLRLSLWRIEALATLLYQYGEKEGYLCVCVLGGQKGVLYVFSPVKLEGEGGVEPHIGCQAPLQIVKYVILRAFPGH